MPTLTFGYLRDDWFLLWNALDPATAPPGSSGVFFRPVARALWIAATGIGGDQPLAMHLPMFGLAIAAAVLLTSVARHLGTPRATAWIAGAGLGVHAALLETRLWAAASNGLWAVVIALVGWRVALGGRSRRRQAIAVAVVLLAGLARADAWALLLPIAMGWPRARRKTAVAIALLGAVGLASVLVQGGGITVDPRAAGHALRLLVVPWGSPWPTWAGVGLLGLGTVAAGLAVARRRDPLAVALIALVLAGPLATGLLPWGAAGRYLVVPVLALSLLVARALPARRAPWALVGLAPHLLTPWLGSTVAELRARAEAETGLYSLVRTMPIPDRVHLVDAPPMGWTDSIHDAENVLSTAARREITVAPTPESGAAALRWIAAEGRWIAP